ncbi:MAG: phosphoribosylanthranilate isomerase [Selenomonadaceae bacterium]|nr:phosphoribosylanthranilate isomerase [Selenomonadaceae bacterium]MBR1858297.1 phosphoribosylanthranilate isomerase [Selenomonadaceae bacterium]
MKVKICGIKTREAAVEADQNGADFIGFIFYRKSHRYINPFKAAEIARSVKCKKVGVFVDENVGVINGITRLVGLDYVQLHGNEDAKYAAKIHRAPIIKAWRYNDELDMREVNNYPCDIILLDSFVKDRVGGTGKTFDWHKASLETRKLTKPFLIAGGISSKNIREVIDIFRPYGVDLSGSLEINGNKSANKIREFLELVHTR